MQEMATLASLINFVSPNPKIHCRTQIKEGFCQYIRYIRQMK